MLHDIKGKLARLLATENLIVEHRSVETAQFDVVKRVLTLPNWNLSSIDVYDLLVAHEVGHALFTDPRDWSKEEKWCEVPQTFVNITEDARIEKLMRRRYGGLSKTFFRGYNDLNDQDFFDIADQDLNKFSLADRINLHFKLGSHVNIEFNEKEMVVVEATANAESFDDALMAAKLLNELITDDKDTQETVAPQEGQNTGTSEQPQMPTSSPEDKESDEESEGDEPSESDGEEETDDETMDGLGGNEPTDETESKTSESLENKLKKLADMSQTRENSYLTFPEISLNHTVIPAAEVHAYAQSEWDEWFKKIDSDVVDYYMKGWDSTNQLYKEFKKSATKEVNYLVKEFECKKSASAYARSTTSRTGVLDCSKLHTYKYNEDLFKKVTVTPDGKNHGLIFVLDWSGSMAEVLIPTIKQLYNLLWFCRKVGIPYDVYAFTSEWNYKASRFNPIPKQADSIHISDEFSMLNLLTSKVNNKTAEYQMMNVWRLAMSFNTHSGLCPSRLYLSGTPLNEALITLHTIIPDFRKRNNVEKLNCVILTDGEASVPSATVMMKRSWESEPEIRHRRIGENTFLRNKKTGSITRLSWCYSTFTKCMLNTLKETFPSTNFIGFRILEHGGQYSNMIRQYTNTYEEAEVASRSWKKQKSFTLRNSGYDSYFVLGNSILSNQTDFDIDDGATKVQIKNAFKKSLSGKKMNKLVLNEFISLVA